MSILRKRTDAAKKVPVSIESLRKKVDPQALPRHVAIIMDGNGRWAQRRGLPRIAGHKKGADSVRTVLEAARKLGISVLTLYAFSDENWGRPAEEVGFLMRMLEQYLQSEIRTLMKNDIRLRVIGRTEKLPPAARDLARAAMDETAGNRGMVLVLALSYGGRGEIIDAVRRIAAEGTPGRNITEEMVASRLDTAGLPDPDLIIRTSGEQRISNFLLWQSAYSEFYFTDTAWPAFGEKDLLLAVLDYQGRQRRFGLVGEQRTRKL